MKHLPEEDLQHVYNHTIDLWEDMRNKSIFITGGTGFFGIWLLESFLYANAIKELNAKIILLTRSCNNFFKRYPHLKKTGGFSLVEGDITNFEFKDFNINFIIHAASGGTPTLNDNVHGSLVEISIDGTRRMLNYASKCKNVKVLYISSGAVYGKQPNDITHLSEDYDGAPDTMKTNSTYGESKRYCELLSTLYSTQYQFEIKIARCFTFVGPYLPLQSNYAIGNFIYDVIKNKQIIIKSDGTPRRSYLYASDLTIWLWKILIKGKSLFPYNVGSDIDISIFDLADKIRMIINPACNIKIDKISISKEVERYVPSIKRVFTDINLKPIVSLDEAIKKTVDWYKNME